MGLLDRFEEEFSGIVKDTTEASAELDQKDKNNRDYIFKLKQLRDLVEYLNQVELLLQEFLTQNFLTSSQAEQLSTNTDQLLSSYAKIIKVQVVPEDSIDFSSKISNTIQQLQDILNSNNIVVPQKKVSRNPQVEKAISSIRESRATAEQLQIMIRQAGHRLGLKDEDYTDQDIFSKTRNYAKERSFDKDSLQWIKESTKAYLNKDTNQEYSKQTKEFMDVIDQAAQRLDKPLEQQASQIADQIKAGKPVMIPSGWSMFDKDGKNIGTHSISIAICPSPDGTVKLIYSNRGDRIENDESNLRIYELNKDLLNDKNAFATQIENLLFLSGVHDQHSQKSVDSVIPNSGRVAKYNPSNQKQNTCGHANKKLIYFGMLEAAHPEADRESLLKEYKKFTTNLRREEINTLAKDCESNDPVKQQVAKELLTAAMMKFASKLDSNDLFKDPKHIRSVALLVELRDKLKDKSYYNNICDSLPQHAKEVMQKINSDDFKLKTPSGDLETSTYDKIMDVYFAKSPKLSLEESPTSITTTAHKQRRP